MQVRTTKLRVNVRNLRILHTVLLTLSPSMSDSLTIFTSLRWDPSLLASPSVPVPPWAGINATCLTAAYMPDLHRDRLLRAAEFFGWTAAVDSLAGPAGVDTLIQRVAEAVMAGQDQTGPLRVKVSIDRDGRFDIVSGLTPSLDSVADLFPECLAPPGTHDSDHQKQRWLVVLDEARTEPSALTHFKTSRREMYSSARARAAIVSSAAEQKETVLVDPTGRIMEGSTTTVYFWRSGRWVTPPTKGRVGAGSGQDDDDEWQGGQDGTTRRWALGHGIAQEEDVYRDSVVDGEDVWISNGVRGFIRGRITL